MPELPEVSKLTAHLKEHLTGARFLGIDEDSGLSKILETSEEEFRRYCLTGNGVVMAVRKFSKYIAMQVGQRVMLSHFKFTGWWELSWAPFDLKFAHPTPKAARFEIRTDRGLLRYTDPRCLGSVWLFNTVSEFASNGPQRKLGCEIDNVNFTKEKFTVGMVRKGKLICDALIEQDYFCGIGNYMRCEVMRRAKVDPWAKYTDLSADKRQALYEAVLEVMNLALASNNYDWWIVFQRKTDRITGEPIVRTEHQKRGIYYNPAQQKPI